MKKKLKILFVEDMPADNELTVFELKNAGFEFSSIMVETENEFKNAIKEFKPEIIISDYSMPEFDGMKALEIAKEICPNIPFILLTGSVNETTAVNCMKAGAHDYILKGHSERLPFAIKEAIENSQLRKEKEIAFLALQKSEEKYKLIAEKTTDVIWLMDLNGKSLFVSPSIINFTGFTVSEYLNQDFNTRFTVESADIAKLTLFKEYSRFADKKEALKNYHIKLELEYLCKNGGTKWGELLITPWFNVLNEPIGIHGVTRDITERKKTEELIKKLSVAVEQSPASVFITDLSAKIEYINKKTLEVTGYNFEELIGKNPDILKSGKTPKETYINLWETILNGNEWRGEFVNKKKNGEEYWESASISSIKNNDGEITHFIAVKEDITKRKQMEKSLVKAKEKAQESDRLKTAFLNNISHEIRTPLNGILGFGGLMKKENLDQETKNKYFNILHASCNRLINTITNYMDMSQLTSGVMPVHYKMFEINILVYEMSFKYKELCKFKNIEYETILPDEIKSFKTYSDPNLLQKVFEHLLDNALKFTQQGKISIGYNIVNDNIEFYISDTGDGISEENHKVIFEKFRQVFTEKRRVIEGSGLGLTISQEILKLIDGKIWVKSQFNVGSTFFVSIPVRTIEEFEKQSSQFKNKKIKKPKILIVEDDYTNMLYMNNVIKENFLATIYEAANGKEAVDIVESQSEIDIILMDLKMPVMDGYTATRTIKALRNDIPVIAISAYSLLDDKEKAFKAGCDDFITKPIDINALLKIIKDFGIIKQESNDE